MQVADSAPRYWFQFTFRIVVKRVIHEVTVLREATSEQPERTGKLYGPAVFDETKRGWGRKGAMELCMIAFSVCCVCLGLHMRCCMCTPGLS